MDYYKQHIDVVVKQFNSNTKLGLDEDAIYTLRQGNCPKCGMAFEKKKTTE